ncbi:hypothetical protein B0H94_11855 [Salsuginibacillus halophilus]|uniref:Uncharacterized protein n=1 Tax=Salsuginibacillus halophilus TaxID=517424 RepID=A0A2P8H687_9BACI|nr:hypothetical protein [Salsuginibacillus halophilus]PSL41742.1 hypothetical protein B0H94_11855 [Salsuginibacillus halophilus]
MDWVKEGLNYWENPQCPREYLEKALVRLINETEGVELPKDHFNTLDEQDLRKEVGFYEYVSDK